MKKYIVTIVMAVLTCTISFGQEVQIPGNWKNTYNSHLNIKEYNKTSGYFTGSYGSTTGSTGRFRVIGFIGKPDIENKSVPITLAVSWRNTPTPSGEPNEKMTSTMTGQIYVDENGHSIMELYHNLQSPLDEIMDNPEFKHAGNFGQTLKFTHEGPPVDNPTWNPSPIIDTPYTGEWNINNDGEGRNVNIVAISQDHVVQATFSDADGTHLLKGFIGDYQNNPEPKSIALAGYNHANNKVIGITGMIGEIPAIGDSSFNMGEISIIIAPKLAPIEIAIKDEKGEIIYRENHPEDQPSKTITVDVKPNVKHTISVKHTEPWGFWDILYWFWGHKDRFSFNTGSETFKGIIRHKPNVQIFTTESRTNPISTTSDLVFDALLVTGQSTYVPLSSDTELKHAYETHYSAAKIEGLYMTGPTPNKASIASFELDQYKNPLANYGATQWTSKIAVGTKKGGGDILNFGVDTGGNFNWANSTQCETASCTDSIHNQFNPATSPTFEWINQERDSVSWGPWGKGVANTGRDILTFLDNDQNPKTDFKLITSFPDNNQFKYFWDGALAMPSSNAKMRDDLTMFLARIMSTGALKIQEEFPVSFMINDENGDLPIGEKGGKIQFGIEDEELFDKNSQVTLPFKSYDNLGGDVSYLWSTDLKTYDMSGHDFGTTLTHFCLDSGSSAIKGDSETMTAALAYATDYKNNYGHYPKMNIGMGILEKTGKTAKFTLTNKEYVPKIERGDHSGAYIPQIQTLDGVDGLLVQGSTLMDHVYTVFVYGTRINPNILDIEMYAKEMRAYNKKGGPEIIQMEEAPQSKVGQVAATLESRGVTVYPNPVRGNLSIRLTSETEEEIQIMFTDLVGRMIYKTSRKTSIGANLFSLKNKFTDPRRLKQQMVILSIINESGTIYFKEKLLVE